MTFRVSAMVRAAAVRESNRLDMGLARGAFPLAFILWLIFSGAVSLQRYPAGPTSFRIYFGMSAWLAIFLAIRLGGDDAGTRSTGWFPLLQMTGIRPLVWIAFRLAQTWIAFASVWIVRVPILLFTLTLGGLRSTEILAAECLLVVVFGVLSSVALLFAHFAKSRQRVFAPTLFMMLAVEVLTQGPRVLVALLKELRIWSAPSALEKLLETWAGLSLSHSVRLAMSQTLTIDTLWPTALLYGALAGLALLALNGVLFRDSDASPAADQSEPALHGKKQRRQRRASHRCWDDALAWQSYRYYGGGNDMLVGKSAVFCVLMIGVWTFVGLGFAETALVLGALGTLVSLLATTNKVTDCLQREIRDKTLLTLLLTPNEALDFYRGWRRGIWRLLIPDLVLWLAMMLTLGVSNLNGRGVVFMVGGVILTSGPFLMLSLLVPFSFKGFVTGMAVVFFLVGMIGLTIGLAVGVASPWLAGMAILISVLFNWGIRNLILARWLNEKFAGAVT